VGVLWRVAVASNHGFLAPRAAALALVLWWALWPTTARSATKNLKSLGHLEATGSCRAGPTPQRSKGAQLSEPAALEFWLPATMD